MEHYEVRGPSRKFIIWNYQGYHDAPLSAGFLELILIFFRCKNAPFWVSYCGKIKFFLHRKKVNLLKPQTMLALSGTRSYCSMSISI